MEENMQPNLFQNPNSIDYDTLTDLLQKYPWFSYLHILWLLKIKQEKPADFERELKKHIIYIQDRKRLFQLLEQGSWEDLTENNDDNSEDNSIEGHTEQREEELLDFSYNGNEDANPEHKNPGPEKNSELTKWIDKLDKKSTTSEHLIDRFLEIDPGPIPADKKSNLEGDVSERSIEETESLITETLAKIYIKQGLYSKAIFAYEKLSLKYPEKSVYFVSQIEKIKNLLSNN